jgi:predicted RND superfamily exporter protein
LSGLRPTRRGLAAALLVALLGSFMGIGLSRARIETGVESFLPASSPALQEQNTLARSFGGDPIVVLLQSKQPKQLLSQQVLPDELGMEGKLSQLSGVAAVYGPASTLNSMAGQAQNLLAELLGRRDGFRRVAEHAAKQAGKSSAQVKAAGQAAVDKFDKRYGPLIVEGARGGLPTLKNERFVQQVIYNSAGQPKPQWHYVVPNDHSLAVLLRPRASLDQAGTEQLIDSIHRITKHTDLPKGTTVTVAGVPTIVAALGTEIRKEIPLIGGIAVGMIALCLLAIPWIERRKRLAPLVATVAATGLTIALLGWLNHPISLGVVAFLSVLLGVGSYYPTYFARGARPRTIAAVAAGTAGSFATLAISPLPFVRDLGMTLAIGIAFAFGLGWLLVGRQRRREATQDAASATTAAAHLQPPPEPVRAPKPPSAARRTRLAALAAVAAVGAAGWGLLPGLPLQTNFQDLTAGLPTMGEVNHVTDAIGSSSQVEIALSGDDVLTPKAMDWMRQAQQRIVSAHGDELHPVLTPPGLMRFLWAGGNKPTGEQIASAERLLPSYLTHAVIRDDGKLAISSFGLESQDLSKVQALLASVRSELPDAPAGYHMRISGLPVVAVAGYHLISGERYLANLAGVVAAGVILLAGLRRRRDALRAVLAAVLATGLELFVLFATGTALNPLTVALGSLTAAVGCEFTVLMTESARRRDMRLRRAVEMAMLTSGLGYGVLAVSDLAVMRQFGILLAGSVVLSYLMARLVVWVWPPDPPNGGAPSGTGRGADTESLAGVS